MAAVTTAPPPTTETRSEFIRDANRGPITSVWAAAPSCTETLRLMVVDSASYLYSGHAYNPYFQPGCMPTGTRAEALLSDPKRWDSYYYSPAICPQSWTPVSTWTSSWYGIDEATVVPLPSETTAVLCCPSGYGKGSWANACASTIQQDTRVTYFQPFSSNGNLFPGSVTVGAFAKGNVVVGDGVPIWYQSSDSKVLAAATQTSSERPTGSQTSSPGTAQTSSSTPLSTNSPAQSSPASEPNSGLSTGAKIGLGVGIPLAIIMGLVLGWLLFRRRKAKTHPPMPNEMAEQQHQYHGAYAPEQAAPKTYYAQTHELDGQLHELPDQPSKPHELPTGNGGAQTAGKVELR